MSGEQLIPISVQLRQPLFYSDKDCIYAEETLLKKIVLQPIFLYDAAFYAGVEALKPWEDKEDFIPVLLAEWNEHKHTLDNHFATRNHKAAKVPMKTAIGYFLELLFWINGKPVDLQADPMDLKIKPINLKERLEFILKRPVFYHAYIQLSELIAEMEKQSIKHLTLEKRAKAPGKK
ncbi:YpoC family protein [Cytobacillus sp. NCCP-133]|uniref:YpoC family protein n=1 Tax=Cytobacillus sp. NCCP-133 TaxID=766848 RepID=UPI002230F53F|nr:hypothetical protein [Cytobacillus sp. NCCP-133]GLB57956.1 hypothetical protein NCCP133_00890 [Cytobacillus sp. NCCP-133]